jgi:hypothetical protein
VFCLSVGSYFGDVFYLCVVSLWSSGQRLSLQIQRPPGFNSRRYLETKVAAPVLKTEITAVGIRRADHVASSIRKSFHKLHRQVAVARSV